MLLLVCKEVWALHFSTNQNLLGLAPAELNWLTFSICRNTHCTHWMYGRKLSLLCISSISKGFNCQFFLFFLFFFFDDPNQLTEVCGTKKNNISTFLNTLNWCGPEEWRIKLDFAEFDRSCWHSSCFYIWLVYYIHEHNDFMKIALGLLWLN